MPDEEIGALSSEEQAYFDTRGDTEPSPEPAKPNGNQPDDPAQPGPDEGPEPAGDPELPTKETVPLATLLEERKAAKELKAKIAEIEKRFGESEKGRAVLEDRWNTILAVGKDAPPADDDPEPDPNVDIFAHSAWQSRQLAKLRGEVTETRTQAEQERQYAQREAAINTVWGKSLNEASAKIPDLKEAFAHMAEQRSLQLKGLAQFQPQFATQEGINAQIDAELKDLIIASANAGISPAEYVYSLAPNYGYTSKPKGPQIEHSASNAVKSLEKAEAAMSAATSLSSASGDRPGAGIDAEAIANMSEKEFAEWYKKPGAAEKWRKAAGG